MRRMIVLVRGRVERLESVIDKTSTHYLPNKFVRVLAPLPVVAIKGF